MLPYSSAASKPTGVHGVSEDLNKKIAPFQIWAAQVKGEHSTKSARRNRRILGMHTACILMTCSQRPDAVGSVLEPRDNPTFVSRRLRQGNWEVLQDHLVRHFCTVLRRGYWKRDLSLPAQKNFSGEHFGLGEGRHAPEMATSTRPGAA